jgi:fructose-bisphosphate aldolase, class I
MNKELLENTAKQMVAPGKGILAIDESSGTASKRFKALGVEPTEGNRQKYRQLLVTAPSIENFVSGYIFFDETLRQSTDEGVLFPEVLSSNGVLPGIKVDQGKTPLTESSLETVTQGLDGLVDRLTEYVDLGAKFAKWRAAFVISKTLPSDEVIQLNTEGLANYALACQEAGLVPMVEPEMLIDGNHSIDRCEEATTKVWDALFKALDAKGVHLPGCILKTSMILSGVDADNRASKEEVAKRTLEALKKHIPSELAGVVFLSGGQGDEEATEHLNLMNQEKGLPWPLSFSYGRSIQRPALEIWAKDFSEIDKAQKALLHRAEANSLASLGKYSTDFEQSRPY